MTEDEMNEQQRRGEYVPPMSASWNPDPGDPFWMLEAEDGEWLKNGRTMLGTRAATKALHFPTELDAYNHPARMSSGCKWWSAKPTEHLWVEASAMPRYKSSNSAGDCQRACNAMRGALASIIADPDCCAASKAIARDALTYHPNSPVPHDMSGAGHTPRPIGYASAEHLSRRTEYERNGSVIYATPCGTSTLPLFAGPLPDLDRSMKAMTEIERMLEAHIQRCRDAVAKCPKWSPAQAEWSRARDALLNFQDDLRARDALAKGRG